MSFLFTSFLKERPNFPVPTVQEKSSMESLYQPVLREQKTTESLKERARRQANEALYGDFVLAEISNDEFNNHHDLYREHVDAEKRRTYGTTREPSSLDYGISRKAGHTITGDKKAMKQEVTDLFKPRAKSGKQ